MPAISRVQQITFRRLSNAQYPWRVNDLSDMHFLSSAAGYADYLLAENATSHDLRGAERQVPPGARICRTPGELVDLLEGQGEKLAEGSSAARVRTPDSHAPTTTATGSSSRSKNCGSSEGGPGCPLT
jgi:hypothetical protein